MRSLLHTVSPYHVQPASHGHLQMRIITPILARGRYVLDRRPAFMSPIDPHAPQRRLRWTNGPVAQHIKHAPKGHQEATQPLKTGICAGRINTNYAQGSSSSKPTVVTGGTEGRGARVSHRIRSPCSLSCFGWCGWVFLRLQRKSRSWRYCVLF